jgi:hypothetical protein
MSAPSDNSKSRLSPSHADRPLPVECRTRLPDLTPAAVNQVEVIFIFRLRGD